jgi:hypothetical protein
MGYGVRDTNRRWPHIVYYDGTPTETVQNAFDIWERKLGSIRFAPAGGGNPAMFKILYSGTCVWRSGDTVNGRSPSRLGELVLGSDKPVGMVLHEVGHLLGLAHEQDRQNCDAAAAWRKKIPNYSLGWEAAQKKTEYYRNIGEFNEKSVMLYGNGYEEGSDISDGDAAAVLFIHGITNP